VGRERVKKGNSYTINLGDDLERLEGVIMRIRKPGKGKKYVL